MIDPYITLDINREADDVAIKKAYLKKVQQYPPEHNGQMFQQVRQAYETIETEYSRLQFDLFGMIDVAMDQLLEISINQSSNEKTRPSPENLIATLKACEKYNG